MHPRAKHIRLQERKRQLENHGFFGKAWYFIWYDNSLWSWLANILLAFILIKFIIYPLIGLALGTGIPVVAVVSESMDHVGSFDHWWAGYGVCDTHVPCHQAEWYAQFNISKAQFLEFPLHNGFRKGDVIVLTGVDPQDVQIGDVIIFTADRPYPIIHRVIDIYKKDGVIYYQTKGDHNTIQIEGVCYVRGTPKESCLDETTVSSKMLLGKARTRLPYLGYLKIGAVDLLQKVFT